MADPEETAAICEAVAYRIARDTGIPADVLLAITLTETGRTWNGRARPWPWTVNINGKGYWFDDRKTAETFIARHHRAGARSFDIGCFQINYRWHGGAFASLEEMFDPLANGRYAARFLGELFEEFSDWSRVAGAYHSRTPKFAKVYRARFDSLRKKLRADRQFAESAPAPPEFPGVAPNQPAAAQRPNRFPLLSHQSAPRALGSLVPLTATPAAGQALIQPEQPG
ncbi:MAG: lytic transglycosylase domain-containing protein [Pseudomonadota bacterium]